MPRSFWDVSLYCRAFQLWTVVCQLWQTLVLKRNTSSHTKKHMWWSWRCGDWTWTWTRIWRYEQCWRWLQWWGLWRLSSPKTESKFWLILINFYNICLTMLTSSASNNHPKKTAVYCGIKLKSRSFLVGKEKRMHFHLMPHEYSFVDCLGCTFNINMLFMEVVTDAVVHSTLRWVWQGSSAICAAALPRWSFVCLFYAVGLSK